MKKNQAFRSLLNEPGSFILPGAYDAMSARIVEELGYKAVYATGAGISNAQLGWADVGLVSLKEVVDVVARITDVTSIPVVVDADTGFGNAINVIRTVKELERAGASAIQLEDQVFPKKCGHFTGKQVISKEEMVYKIKAALDARYDQDFAIIARTDALAVSGIEEALERAAAYREAGADVLFVEAPTTLEEVERIGREFKGVPLVLNLVEGAKTPLVSLEEAERMGFKIVLCANTALRAAIRAVKDTLQTLKENASQIPLLDRICTWEERQKLFKLHEIQEWENKYLQL
mgnify:CR=1 FL=1